MRFKFRMIRLIDGTFKLQFKKKGILNIFSKWIDCDDANKNFTLIEALAIEVISNKMCH